MTTQNANVKVHHVTRVEGHGNIVVNVKNGEMFRKLRDFSRLW